MGYYKKCKLLVGWGDNAQQSFEHEARVAKIVTDRGHPHPFRDEVKWYESNQDLARYSMVNPNHVFCLECVGEDGRLWRDYFFQGKMQKCSGRIVWDDFVMSAFGLVDVS